MSYSDLRADWREFSDEKMKSFPSTRGKANAEQSKYYFTGKSCTKGHVTIRYRASTSCVICHAEREKARKQKPKSTFVRKEKTQPVMFMGIKVSRSLSDNTD